jgi:hypothetical protein
MTVAARSASGRLYALCTYVFVDEVRQSRDVDDATGAHG